LLAASSAQFATKITITIPNLDDIEIKAIVSRKRRRESSSREYLVTNDVQPNQWRPTVGVELATDCLKDVSSK